MTNYKLVHTIFVLALEHSIANRSRIDSGAMHRWCVQISTFWPFRLAHAFRTIYHYAKNPEISIMRKIIFSWFEGKTRKFSHFISFKALYGQPAKTQIPFGFLNAYLWNAYLWNAFLMHWDLQPSFWNFVGKVKNRQKNYHRVLCMFWLAFKPTLCEKKTDEWALCLLPKKIILANYF